MIFNCDYVSIFMMENVIYTEFQTQLHFEENIMLFKAKSHFYAGCQSEHLGFNSGTF